MALFSVVMLLSGCLQLLRTSPSSEQEQAPEEKRVSDLQFGEVKTFQDGFNEMAKIDEKYKTTFRQERLGTFVVDQQDIVPMQRDLWRLVEHIKGTRDIDFEALSHDLNRTDVDLTLLFITARIEMLESERHFQLGYRFGNAGLVGDGFFCSERPFIIESIAAFNESVKHGLNSTYYLDALLSDLNGTTPRVLIGVDDKKPEFYKAPFQTMGAQLKKNMDLVRSSCLNATDENDVYVTLENTQRD